MLRELARRGGVLYEPTTALEVVRLFGGAFCDVNADDAFTLGRDVLDAFALAALAEEREVVWSDADRAWSYTGKRPSPYR